MEEQLGHGRICSKTLQGYVNFTKNYGTNNKLFVIITFDGIFCSIWLAAGDMI